MWYAARLLDLGLVAVLAVSSAALGIRVLPAAARRSLGAIESLLVAFAAGSALLAVAILGLGFAGLLSSWSLWLLPAVSLGWWRGELGCLRDAWVELREVLQRSGRCLAAAWWTVAGLGVLTLGLGNLPPSTDWDSLMYHLEISKEFLTAGRIFVPADNLHVAYFGLPQMLYLPLLSLGGEQAAAMMSSLQLLFLVLATLAVGSRLFGPTTGVCASMLLWGSSVLVLIGITARVDIGLALNLFLAHSLLVPLESEGDRRWALPLAAVLAGCAVGFKYQALVYSAALAPLGLWSLVRRCGGTRQRLRLAALCVVLFAVGSVPWLAKNQALLGSPVFPFLADSRLPPWLESIATTVGKWPEGAPEAIELTEASSRMANLSALFLRPDGLSAEGEARSYYPNLAFLLLPLALFHRRRAIALALLGPSLVFVLGVVIPFHGFSVRYFVAVLPMLTLVSAEVLRGLAERWLPAAARGVALTVACLLAAVGTGRAVAREVIDAPHLGVILGVLSPERFLLTTELGRASHLANRWVPPGGRILLLFEARGYRFRRPALQDNLLTNWPLLWRTGVTQTCLKGTGISHVLVNEGAMDFYSVRGLETRLLDWAAFETFRARCLNEVFEDGGFRLYQVRVGRNGE